ncbi:hypothetical protein [Methylobacterium marchantiae]|uniref:Uncharacterized protein n=1 Tax=Methylobacterium marchantiae TaxID=600331 RepID=A0ABW3WXM2_9HYPH
MERLTEPFDLAEDDESGYDACEGADLAPWIALVLKLGSVDQETDDEEEPVQ